MLNLFHIYTVYYLYHSMIILEDSSCHQLVAFCSAPIYPISSPRIFSFMWSGVKA
jgi:hypothetical protein